MAKKNMSREAQKQNVKHIRGACAEPFQSYYPVVPTVVGTSSNCDKKNFEASGGWC